MSLPCRCSPCGLFRSTAPVADQFRHLDFKRIRNSKARAVLGGGADGIDNDFRRMAENGRPPGADVINVFVAIHVPDARAFRALDEKRLAADVAKRADGRIHAAGIRFCAAVKRLEDFVTRQDN